MATIDGEARAGNAKIERLLLGAGLLIGAVVEVYADGALWPVAGLLAAAAVYLLRPSKARENQAVNSAIDFLAMSGFGLLADHAAVLWRAPETFNELFSSDAGRRSDGGSCLSGWGRHFGRAFVAGQFAWRFFCCPFCFVSSLRSAHRQSPSLAAFTAWFRCSADGPRNRREDSGSVPAERGGGRRHAFGARPLFAARMAAARNIASWLRCLPPARLLSPIWPPDTCRRICRRLWPRRQRRFWRRSRKRGYGAKPIWSRSRSPVCCGPRPRCRSSFTTIGRRRRKGRGLRPCFYWIAAFYRSRFVGCVARGARCGDRPAWRRADRGGRGFPWRARSWRARIPPAVLFRGLSGSICAPRIMRVAPSRERPWASPSP